MNGKPTRVAGRALQGLIERFGIIQPESEDTDNSKSSGKKRAYGDGAIGSVNWNAVRLASVKDLEESIKFGGLQAKKARTIKEILDRVWNEGKLRRKIQRHEEALLRASDRVKSSKGVESDSELTDVSDEDDDDGELTLHHLHKLDNVDLLEKLIEYPGIGYKAASCVMLFCRFMMHEVFS